ncbi:MAG: winged helix-turn-helix transcriptional regulator [Methanobrevibacter boviskoreani]|jgi:DNA-binding HxlR family transcriptional regulator|uniref:winged helix-turn-helix transcriptional regulator n=1 Tax=Methanobrevibacter boviskoreani TaxID=1348249 RepID=UPI0025881838|nr:helix-turn-helix domain-containing protein [uncultured Methanobrevibacter sp.]
MTTNIESAIKNCPVELSLGLITKKWTILLVKDMFFGKTRFKEFKEGKDITNKILSKRLKEMEDAGLITRSENPYNSNDVEYHLTDKGKSLNSIIYDLAMFTVDNDGFNLYYTEDEKEEIRKMFKDKLDLESED